MANLTNYVSIIGRVAGPLNPQKNSDGSRTLLGTLYVDRPYRNQGEYKSDQIPFSVFVPANVQHSKWEELVKGQLIGINGSLERLPYTDKNTGDKKYPELRFVAEGLPQYLEPKSVTDNRRQQDAAQQYNNTPVAPVQNQGYAAPQQAPVQQPQQYNVPPQAMPQAPVQQPVQNPNYNMPPQNFQDTRPQF